MTFAFVTTPRIICESGGLSRIGALMDDLGARRVLIVTDPGIAACGFADEAARSLEAAGIAAKIFSEVEADPPIALVERGAAAAREFRADGVIGLGGGSSLDTAKVVALAAATGQKVADMVGFDKAAGNRLALVQVPTTAGTGAEMTWAAVLTSDSHEKVAVYATQLLPDIALLDAKLTLGMPREITAATGLDAMVHAVEAATSRTRKNPISDGLAEKALELLGQNLPRVLDHPDDAAAREAMLLGANLAGNALINASVASIHALAYPLGTHFRVPHGHAIALVMAPVLRFNLSVAEADYARLGRALLPQRQFGSQHQAATAMIESLDDLFRASGLPLGLRAVGVGEADLDSMAQEVTTGITRLLVNNPREMTTDDVVALYREAL